MAETITEGTVVNDVLIGKAGCLFLYSGGQRQMQHLTGEVVPHPDSVANFAANIADRTRMCRQLGIGYAHAVFPSKPVVYRHLLPDSHAPHVQSLFLRAYRDAVLPWMDKGLIYPLAALQVHDAEQPVYRMHDTHMTDAGYSVMISHMLEQIGLPHTPAELVSRKATLAASGDLLRMLGWSDKPPITVLGPRAGRSRVYDNRYLLSGNTHNVVTVLNPEFQGSRRLLVTGDSFIKTCLPFLAVAFSDILYVRSQTLDPDLVAAFEPDFILSGNAERYMSAVVRDASKPTFLESMPADAMRDTSAPAVTAFVAQCSLGTDPSAYATWRARQLDENYLFDGIRLSGHSPHARITSRSPMVVHSTGDDPHVTLMVDHNKDPRSSCTVSMVLDSNVQSYAKIYFIETGMPLDRFSEQCSLAQLVKPGLNTLTLVIDRPAIAPVLRFDPLACAGRVVVHQMRVN